MFMMETGKMAKCMVQVSIRLTVLGLKVFGSMVTLCHTKVKFDDFNLTLFLVGLSLRKNHQSIKINFSASFQSRKLHRMVTFLRTTRQGFVLRIDCIGFV